jgi:hypothetical protein
MNSYGFDASKSRWYKDAMGRRGLWDNAFLNPRFNAALLPVPARKPGVAIAGPQQGAIPPWFPQCATGDRGFDNCTLPPPLVGDLPGAPDAVFTRNEAGAGSASIGASSAASSAASSSAVQQRPQQAPVGAKPNGYSVASICCHVKMDLAVVSASMPLLTTTAASSAAKKQKKQQGGGSSAAASAGSASSGGCGDRDGEAQDEDEEDDEEESCLDIFTRTALDELEENDRREKEQGTLEHFQGAGGCSCARGGGSGGGSKRGAFHHDSGCEEAAPLTLPTGHILPSRYQGLFSGGGAYIVPSYGGSSGDENGLNSENSALGVIGTDLQARLPGILSLPPIFDPLPEEAHQEQGEKTFSAHPLQPTTVEGISKAWQQHQQRQGKYEGIEGEAEEEAADAFLDGPEFWDDNNGSSFFDNVEALDPGAPAAASIEAEGSNQKAGQQAEEDVVRPRFQHLPGCFVPFAIDNGPPGLELAGKTAGAPAATASTVMAAALAASSSAPHLQHPHLLIKSTGLLPCPELVNMKSRLEELEHLLTLDESYLQSAKEQTQAAERKVVFTRDSLARFNEENRTLERQHWNSSLYRKHQQLQTAATKAAEDALSWKQKEKELEDRVALYRKNVLQYRERLNMGTGTGTGAGAGGEGSSSNSASSSNEGGNGYSDRVIDYDGLLSGQPLKLAVAHAFRETCRGIALRHNYTCDRAQHDLFLHRMRERLVQEKLMQLAGTGASHAVADRDDDDDEEDGGDYHDEEHDEEDDADEREEEDSHENQLDGYNLNGNHNKSATGTTGGETAMGMAEDDEH